MLVSHADLTEGTRIKLHIDSNKWREISHLERREGRTYVWLDDSSARIELKLSYETDGGVLVDNIETDEYLDAINSWVVTIRSKEDRYRVLEELKEVENLLDNTYLVWED